MNTLTPHHPISLQSDPLQEQEPAFRWLDEMTAFLRRQWSVILGCLAVMLVLTTGYLITSSPRFTATSTLMIDMRRADVFRQQPLVADPQIMNAFIESEVEVLRSEGLARKIVTALRLTDAPEFNRPRSLTARLMGRLHAALSPASGVGHGSGSDHNEQVAQQLLRMTSVRRIGMTYIIEVDVTAATPREAATLANGITSAYMSEQLAAKEESTREAVGWLQKRLEELRQQALSADQAVQAFKAQHGIVDTGHGLMNEQQLTELDSKLVAARAGVAEAKARLDQIELVLQSAHGAADAVPDTLQSTVINALRQAYLEDSRHEAEWTAKYGRDHVAAVKLRQDMARLQDSIHSEIARTAQAAKSSYMIALANDAAVQLQLDTLVRQNETTDTLRATLRSLQSSADTYRSLYATFLQRYTQAAQDESFPVSEARVVTSAVPPLAKSKPKAAMLMAVACIAGLGIGFGLGLLRDLLDRGLRTAEDIETRLDLPCLASLTDLDESGVASRLRRLRLHLGRRARGTALAAAAASRTDDPASLFAQGIRRIRLRMLQLLAPDQGAVIGIVSAAAGDGSSTIACSLAEALAASGRSTALLTSEDGHVVMTAWNATLRSEALADSVHPIGPHQSRMQRFQRPVVEAEQHGLGAWLEELRGSWNFVIVDLPPLHPTIEAHLWLEVIDIALLVVRFGRTTDLRARRLLLASGVDRRRVMGAVLNRVPRPWIAT